jgi:hypothetical protein
VVGRRGRAVEERDLERSRLSRSVGGSKTPSQGGHVCTCDSLFALVEGMLTLASAREEVEETSSRQRRGEVEVIKLCRRVKSAVTREAPPRVRISCSPLALKEGMLMLAFACHRLEAGGGRSSSLRACRLHRSQRGVECGGRRLTCPRAKGWSDSS